MNLIFQYLKDKNFKYRLASYSKSLQKKLMITLLDYQGNYFSNKRLEFYNYIYSTDNMHLDTFDKNIYNKRLEKDLKNIKFEKKDFDKIVFNYYNGVKEEIDEDTELKIDIYSPFFDIISRSFLKHFNYFGIPISINIMNKLNLKKDYISVFEKMNNSNIKYNSLYIYYKDIEDINYLNELKINFNNIKKLVFSIDDAGDDEDNKEKESKGNFVKKYDCLKKFFSFNNFKDNLVYLDLILPKKGNFKLESNLFKNVNFQSLKLLGLSWFKFKTNFEIKLNNLEGLSLNHCENISLIGDNCKKMENLNINKAIISESKSVLKFPNLEECYLLNMENQIMSSFIDFSSLKKVKTIQCEKYDFKYLDNDILETVELNSEVNYHKEFLDFINDDLSLDSNKMIEMEKEDESKVEKEVIEKLIQIKTLKKITLDLCEINNQQISQIKGFNPSVTELIINWNTSHIYAQLDSLQKKFPNLSYFELKLPYFEDIWGDFEEHPPYIKINPKDNCKITKFSLGIQRYNNYFRFDFAHIIN